MVCVPRDVIYEKGKLKITHLYSPDPEKENEIISVEKHELWLKAGEDDWLRYLLPRDALRELRNDFKKGLPELVDKLGTLNKSMLFAISQAKVEIEEVGKAIEYAYLNELEGPEDYLLMTLQNN